MTWETFQATPAHWRAVLGRILPRGPAWDDSEGTDFGALLDGMAEELSRLDVKLTSILDELDPRTTTLLIDELEAIAGLPDPCDDDPPESLPARRLVLHAHLTAHGGATPAYFIALAAKLGYTVTIEEPKPFKVESGRIGDRLYGDAWAHAFYVKADATEIIEFRVGEGRIGDPLREWGDSHLECLIDKHKPAHTTAVHTYGE